MRLKRPTIDVPKENPFQNDQLSRASTAKLLTDFVSSIEESFVLSLESGWGHGKTTFIRMWSQHLENEGFVSLYFNAWEADYAQDPLIPFIGEIGSQLSRRAPGKSDDSRLQAQMSELKRVSIQVAKRSLPVAAKILTAGLLQIDDFSEKTLAETLEKLVREKFDEYESEKTTLKNFRTTLAELIGTLQGTGNTKPLIFFVDELDRCRPPFAIALLERIKHLFDVSGIVFVLALDKAQLVESVRGVYGAGCDATRYLRRFIDLEYSLPDPAREQYPRYLMQVYGFHEAFPKATGEAYADKQFVETFSILSEVYGLRLRDQGYAFSLLAIVWRTLRPNEPINPFVAAFSIALKVGNSESFRKLVANQLPLREVLDAIGAHPAGAAFLAINYGAALEAFLITYLGTHDQVTQAREAVEHESKSAANAALEPNRVAIMLKILGGGSRREIFDKLVRALGVAEQFAKEGP